MKISPKDMREKLQNSFLITCIIAGYSFFFNTNILSHPRFQQFIFLAHSFLNGKLHFIYGDISHDYANYMGILYWPLGPMPAILLTPLVGFFGEKMRQGYMQFVLIIIIFFLLYKIAKLIIKRRTDSLWLSFGYVCASAFAGVAFFPFSWQFAQVVATTFLLLAILEYLSKKRFFLIGIFLLFAIATRFNLVLACIFFVLDIIFQKTSIHKKRIQFVKFILPLSAGLILLFIYNYLRFHNIFEQGYSYQHLVDPYLIANKNRGLWGFIHFPANFYYLFIKSPDAVFIPGTQILQFPYIVANYWGMGMFFTSPLFLWIIMANIKIRQVRNAFITIFVLIFAILGYYGIGYVQFGYRYALDFYPFLFICLAYVFKDKKISLLLKLVIVLSFVFNFYVLNLSFNT